MMAGGDRGESVVARIITPLCDEEEDDSSYKGTKKFQNFTY